MPTPSSRRTQHFVVACVFALHWAGTFSALTVIRKQPKALSKGRWTYEDPVGNSRFGQYIYSSPMNKTCKQNLTIHLSSWICGVYVGGTPYFEAKTCIPDSYDMPAVVVDKLNSQGHYLENTCIQLSAYHVEYYTSPIQHFTEEIIDAAVRHPIKHGLSIATHWAQAIAFSKGASLMGRPLIQTYILAFGFIYDFEPVKTMFRLQSDLKWTLDGTLEMLPQRFAVLYDGDSASEAGPPIRAAVARKNKEIGLSFIIPAYTPADSTRTDEPHNQFIDELLATGLRYVLLVTNPEYTHAVLACKLYKRGLHKHIKVFSIMGMPFYAAYGSFRDKECSSDTGAIVTEQGGWWGLTYALPGAEDDAVINSFSGATGMPDEQSYGLDGNPWQDNSLVVKASLDCHDDEEGLSRVGLQGVVNKGAEENLTCKELMHFGQTRRQAYLHDIAKYCPISACAYNRMMPACRTSCACSDPSLKTSWGASLCVTIKDLVLDYADDGSTSKDYRCEGKHCRPLAYAPSTKDFTSPFTKFSDASAATGTPNASIGGWCPPPYSPCSVIGHWAIYNLLMPGITDGVWAQAMGFKCIEEKFGAAGLERVARFDFGDQWVTENLVACLEEVEFEGSVGRISFKEQDGHSSTPGYTPILITESQWSSYRLYSTSGYLKPGGMVHSTHVIRRKDHKLCTPWSSTFGPGMTCPEGTEVEYTLEKRNFDVVPLGEPANCTPGLYPLTINETESIGLTDHCQHCQPGTFKDTYGSGRCLPCPDGWSIESVGAHKCLPCPFDTYSSEPQRSVKYGGIRQLFGSSSCVACPVGSVQPQPTGSKTCVCDQGYYGMPVSQGAPNCTRCIGGKTTTTIGATSADFCLCPPETYVSEDRNSCIPCEDAFECKGGNEPPSVREGYFAGIRADLPVDAFVGVDGAYSVFRCYSDKRNCPAGRIGECAEGREGIACAICKPGMVDAGNGTCEMCAGRDILPFAAACIVALGLAVCMYHVVDNENRATQSHSVLFLGLISGMLISNLQHLAVLSTISVTFVEPVKSLMTVIAIFNFDIDVLQLGCVASFNPLGSYVVKICSLPVCLFVAAIIHCIFVLFKYAGQFLKRLPSLVGIWGTLTVVFFIAMVHAAIAPYQCLKHPNGLSTVLRYPTVICEVSAEHNAMVGAGAAGLVVPISFAVGCIWVVYKFPKKMQKQDTKFLHTFAFLFFRFQPDRYWYVIFFIIRNLIIALAPTAASNLTQVLIIIICFVVSLTCTTSFRPWRVINANYADILITMAMIVFLSIVGFLVSAVEETPVAIALSVCVVGSFAVIVCFLTYGVYAHFSQRGLKPFKHFICHHKGGAGAAARCVKIELKKRTGKSQRVFIDCDDLQNLDLLFDYVGSLSEHVVVLLSKELYLRPWCIGELVTGHLKRVDMIPVIFPDFVRPDDEFIQNYTGHVDISCLAPHGISFDMVAAMLKWHRDLPALHLPNVLSSGVFQDLGKSIADHGCHEEFIQKTSLVDNEEVLTSTIAVADHSNLEAAATAVVLCGLLLPRFSHDMSKAPKLLLAEELLPPKTQLCIFVLSNGCFLNASYVKAMTSAARFECKQVPVISEDGYRFPSASMLEEFKAAVPTSLAPHGIREAPETLMKLIQSLFKEIAVVFAPQDYSSTDELLNTKAEMLKGRLQSGLLQTLHLESFDLPKADIPDIPKKRTQYAL